MKQYCRYCAHCFCLGDEEFGCSNHPKGEQPIFNMKEIKRVNNCEHFILSDLGCVITGNKYKERKPKKKNKCDYQQLSLW